MSRSCLVKKPSTSVTEGIVPEQNNDKEINTEENGKVTEEADGSKEEASEKNTEVEETNNEEKEQNGVDTSHSEITLQAGDQTAVDDVKGDQGDFTIEQSKSQDAQDETKGSFCGCIN